MKKQLQKINLLFCLIACLSINSFAQNQNALDFDNVDDLVMVPFGSAGIAEGEAMSMTAWVFPGNPTPGWPDFDGIMGFRMNLMRAFTFCTSIRQR